MVHDTAGTPPRLADDLLTVLAPLSHPRRMRELAVRARAASARGELAALLAELTGRGTYERRLAAAAAAAGGRRSHLEARLADPDPVVRAHAHKAARRGGATDQALEAALEDAPAVVRRQVIRTVVASRRTALADRLVDPLRERWGDTEAARLLPACGEATVARLLPEVFHAVTSWRSLASNHPAAVLDEAERQLAALPEGLHRDWWPRYAPAVALAARAEPVRVLDLLEARCHGTLPPPVRSRLGAFAAVDPGRTLRLLLSPQNTGILRDGSGRGLSRSTLRRLILAPEPADLARALSGAPAALARLLATVPPSRREALFEAATAERDLDHADLDPAVLDVLPRPRREAEARRAATRARERGAPWATVLEAVARLPVDEAREDLLEATRRPSAEDRAFAYALLVRNAARDADPRAVTSLLRLLERLRNEQDPVRSAALAALAGVPPALFTDAAADHLDPVAAEAIQARDSSPATRQALRRLAVALLREHAVTGQRELIGWALRTITRLAGGVGRTDLGQLDHTLRRGQEHAVFEALRPWLEAGADRVDHELTFALAHALGRRAHAIPELQDLLRQAISFGSDTTVRTAVALWLDDPATRDARVEELLTQEPSAAVLPPVLHVLAHRRTDLLDPVLGPVPPYGRFLTRGTDWTPPVGPCAARWLPRQQAAAGRLLARTAADTALRPDRRVRAIEQAAHLPDAGADLVGRWTGAEDVVLAEAALAALVRTDRPGDALPALLARAGDDRARVALYAANRATLYVPPSRLRAPLREVLLPAAGARSKVTSRKEAARLVACRLPVADAAALLTEAYQAPEAHHDVRAACVTRAAGLLGRPEAWKLLGDAVAGRRELRRAVLRTGPLDLPEPHRARYAQLVRAVCDTDDPEVAAAGYDALAAWSPWAPDAASVLVAAVTDLTNRATWREAAAALLNLAATSPHVTAADNPVAWVLAALVAADARPGTPDAEPDRDRPARRRIWYIAAQLATHGRMRPRAMRSVATAAAELLAGYEPFVPDAADILVNVLDLRARPGTLTAGLARLGRLHLARPVLAARTADTLAGRLRTAGRPGSDEALLRAARQLGGDSGHASGLFAVALSGVGGERTDWAAPWRELLRVLRRHPHPDVRDAALLLETARE